jgi:hypothetical protein
MTSALITILETDDVVLIAVAKAALEAEGIPYISQGKGFQDWLFPGGYNPVTGPVRFQVATEDAERAREILEGIVPSS